MSKHLTNLTIEHTEKFPLSGTDQELFDFLITLCFASGYKDVHFDVSQINKIDQLFQNKFNPKPIPLLSTDITSGRIAMDSTEIKDRFQILADKFSEAEDGEIATLPSEDIAIGDHDDDSHERDLEFLRAIHCVDLYEIPENIKNLIKTTIERRYHIALPNLIEKISPTLIDSESLETQSRPLSQKDNSRLKARLALGGAFVVMIAMFCLIYLLPIHHH